MRNWRAFVLAAAASALSACAPTRPRPACPTPPVPPAPLMAGLPEAGAFGDRLDEIIQRGRTGEDIGPDLEQLAEDAGAVTAQCRGLQGWLKESL